MAEENTQNQTEEKPQGSEKIEEKIKGTLSRGVEVSKKAFEKAGGAVQRFSDKSVLRLEKKQLQGRKAKKYAELGEVLSNLLEIENASIKKLSDIAKVNDAAQLAIEQIESIQADIKSLKQEIQKKDDAINAC